jgi:hypothetical protein
MSKDINRKIEMRKTKKEIAKRGKRGTASIKDFSFIGAGKSRQGRLRPVSVRHDEALEEVFASKRDLQSTGRRLYLYC